MEEAKGGGTIVQLFVAVLTAILGLIIYYSIYVKRQDSKAVKKDAAAESGVKSQAPSLPQPSQASKKNTASAKLKALAAEKAHQPRHHLDLVSLKGHGDAVTGVAFTSNGRGLATGREIGFEIHFVVLLDGSACADQVVRVFKLEDAFSKSFKFLRLNLPRGSTPTGVAFGVGASQLVVSTQDIGGAGLCMFAAGNGKAAAEAKAQGKLPLPEIKWENQHIHGSNNILTLVGAPSSSCSDEKKKSYVVVASCSEGTDIKLWRSEDGRCVGTVDTNQLKNTMATLSPNGRYLAAAAFTADVKVWELIYSKDGEVQTVEKVMQLKGHKIDWTSSAICKNSGDFTASAATWLCFTWDSERIITASKDGTIRIWNINVRYHLDEDPKCLKVFPIPLQDAKGGGVVLYERLAVSPDGRVLAASHGHTLQWLSTETGSVLDTAERAHDGDILSLVWSPEAVPTERGKAPILATASSDKKVKLWFPPTP